MKDSSSIISKISNILYIYRMVTSYCVKDKEYTECVPGSERIVKTKKSRKIPSRTMMKCTCAKCGITKTKFVKSGTTQSGSGRKASTKPYCGIGKVPKDRIRGNRSQCIDQGQIRYYGLNTIPEEAIETIKKSNSTFRRQKKKSGN